MVNNDYINHDHDDMSISTSSFLSSTTVKFYGSFGSNHMSVHVFDWLTGIERSNNNNNNYNNLTNISDSEINHDGNDNQTHSVFYISSSISSSSSVCIINCPSSILIPLVSPEIPVYDKNQEEGISSFYVSNYPITMVKNNKTTKQEILDIQAGKSKPSACSRRPPTLFKLSSGSNNNINNNSSNKNHNTKKKKTPSAAKSTSNAINKAGNSSKLKKRSWAQQRSPHICDNNNNDNDDDYYQTIPSIVITLQLMFLQFLFLHFGQLYNLLLIPLPMYLYLHYLKYPKTWVGQYCWRENKRACSVHL